MPTDPRILTHPGLAPLWDGLERERRQQQFFALALMIAALVSIVVGVVSLRPAWGLVGGVVATGSLWWLFRLVSEQPAAYWRRELRENPEDIVWVYGMVTERMPFGFRTVRMETLYFVDRAGDIHSFPLRKGQTKLVTRTLNRVLPHAEFGYTPEREMAYRGEVTDFRGRRWL